MFWCALALATTRSDQLSALRDTLEPLAEQATTEPALARELASVRLALLDAEGALEAATWAGDPELIAAARLLGGEAEGTWLTLSNRWCIDLLSNSMVDAAFEKCVHSDLETSLLEGIDRDLWPTARQAAVTGFRDLLFGQPIGVRMDGETIEVLHQRTLRRDTLEDELRLCPEGCSSARLGVTWMGITDEDREALLGTEITAITRLDLKTRDGLVIGVGLSGGELFITEEQLATWMTARPVTGAAPTGVAVAPDAPGGGPTTGESSRHITLLAAILGALALVGLWRVSRPG